MNLTLSHTNILSENSETESRLFFIIYPELMQFLGSMDAAAFVQRLHFWLQNPNAGYLLKDGRKRILNGYKEWATQFSIFSIKKIGAIVRSLERIGWLKTDKFYSLKREIGFVGTAPLLQEDNQRKWYYLDYQKILQDTGFDLLFTQEKDNSTLEPKRRKCPPEANIPNQDIAMSQIGTLQCPDLGQSSIHRESNKTKYSQEESESKFKKLTDKKEFQIENVKTNEEIQQGSNEGATILGQDKCSAASWDAQNEKNTTSSSQHSVRPLRQSPKMQYPPGPWLTEGGCLNEDFLRDQANLWRTGDTPSSRAFGAMSEEDLLAIVATHYQKATNHAKLETHWQAYVRKAQRYLGNVRSRIDAEIALSPAEQTRILAKAPAVSATPTESIYEMDTSHLIKAKADQSIAAGGEQMIAAEATQAIAAEATQVIAPEATQPTAPIDEKFGCQNVAAYRNTVKEEDRDFWARANFQAKGVKAGVSGKNISSLKNIIESLPGENLKGVKDG